ncbi:hypothetical protein XENOCAPTIV_007291 [Xenoophorus captivus]|uniref:Uncharacterized protein n=1 Tax=Xenoophorus captivus TaxID=1517983 RepID=A0ABV0RHA2_9TELE
MTLCSSAVRRRPDICVQEFLGDYERTRRCQGAWRTPHRSFSTKRWDSISTRISCGALICGSFETGIGLNELHSSPTVSPEHSFLSGLQGPAGVRGYSASVLSDLMKMSEETAIKLEELRRFQRYENSSRNVSPTESAEAEESTRMFNGNRLG